MSGKVEKFMLYEIQVCDDMGKPVYSKTILTHNQEEADNKAYFWSVEVEATEGWFTTWRANLLK